MTQRHKILLVQPPLGMSGTFVRHAPLSLIYAASEVVKAGYQVEIFDARLAPATWLEDLASKIDDGTMVVGVTVMTGTPVLRAIEVGQLVKRLAPEVKVVWGGPFATFQPEAIISGDPNCDFVVSGYGAVPFLSLAEAVGRGELPHGQPGVFWRGSDGGMAGMAADWSKHEIIPFREIPYDLIPDYSVYGQLDQKRIIFSLYTAMGCPYQCAFCSSPALYRHIQGKRWVPLPAEEVADHVAYVVERYGAQYIYFIDDDSFVDLGHVESVIDAIAKRGISVKLGFRGARINEIKKMDHAFLDKLVRAGTDILHIGAETGSNRLLQLVRKNCTVEDILECNRKLAKHPEIFAFYNFIVGLPTETIEDLKLTSNLMLRLIEENPHCIISTPNFFRPLPGTELYDLARKRWSFRSPESLQEWGAMEVETQYDLPWIDKQSHKYFSMMLMASYFIDDKINKMPTGNSMLMRMCKLANALYQPIAKFRMKHGCTRFLLERWVYNLAQKMLGRTSKQTD